MKIAVPLACLGLALLAAGCESTTSPYPHITYPATYQLQVGNSQVNSSYGPQSSNVTASQRVTVEPGVPLYYQVVSPVAVTAYVYQDDSSGNHTLIGEMQGTDFNSSITPQTQALDFAFAVSNANSSGTLQFTLSDRPIARPPTPAPPPPPPPPQ